MIAIHVCEAARQKAYAVAKTPQFAEALRKRRKVEALFSELKNLVGLRRLRLRRIKFVRDQFYLAAVAQNLKRLVRFLAARPQPIPAYLLLPRILRRLAPCLPTVLACPVCSKADETFNTYKLFLSYTQL